MDQVLDPATANARQGTPRGRRSLPAALVAALLVVGAGGIVAAQSPSPGGSAGAEPTIEPCVAALPVPSGAPASPVVDADGDPCKSEELLGGLLGKQENFVIIVNLTNSSDKDLIYMSADTHGKGQMNNQPASVLTAAGGTDRIDYESDNVGGGEIELSYRVDGTEDVVKAFFQVPTVGANEAACGGTKLIYIGACDIGHGYRPDAHVDFQAP